ncbi:hypothetical protein HD553DRAFT_129537 [Filobasidium floriforme]|uniref:uncharacterized protein n=1 Tax=Filobasidium floriforme TaxID=5210 RepID=UPI001E8DE2DA|nr:uncharacterized protein HD553DRAFT_129537 [Filobasidium floriforme]KAH8079671.1 hypothetical protein HD553DRAFT_129537 [Filobasidium floriforme]
MKFALVSTALTAAAFLSPFTNAQGYQQHAYQAPLPVHTQNAPAPAPGIGLQVAQTLEGMTGWNVTGMYARVIRSKEFDRTRDEAEGFIRLTDRNYDSLVKHEQLPEGGKERVWFSIIHAPPSDVTSTAYLDAMTNAARIARSNKTDPLDHIKWGRIDFLTETELAARWLVFKPPVFVIATDRGKDLRFLTPRMVGPNGTTLETIMREEHWKNAPIWNSAYAPGGSRAFIVDWYVRLVQLWSKFTTTVPSWALLFIMPMATQQIMSWMHSGAPTPSAGAAPASARPVPAKVVAPKPTAAGKKSKK